MTTTAFLDAPAIRPMRIPDEPVAPSYDLAALICQTAVGVSQEAPSHVFVFEPPDGSIRVAGEPADLIQVLSAVLHSLVDLSPGGADISLWTAVRPLAGRQWGGVRMSLQLKAHTAEDIEKAMDSAHRQVLAAGARLDLYPASSGMTDLALWLPCVVELRRDSCNAWEVLS